MTDDILQFIKKVQAISHAGLSYSKDPFALENYEELKAASIQILEQVAGIGPGHSDLYRDYAYPTPQAAVRTLVIDQEKILFVREKESGRWSLPGGWCDIGLTPSENAAKEVREESGYHVQCTRLLAIYDRRNYLKKSLYDIYCFYFLAVPTGGYPHPNHETTQVEWFPLDNLPPLSRKNSREEILKAYEVYKQGLPAYFE